MSSTAYHKLTRRGKVLRVVKEHYLRDDIPCGMEGCPQCPAPEAAASAAAASAAFAAAASNASGGAGVVPPQEHTFWLSPEPTRGVYVVLDTNTVLHQMDLLEAGAGLFDDVVVLQTVMEETRHRHATTYRRLRALMRDPQRRFVAFSNVHHRETYSPRKSGESPNDYNDRLIREACSFLQQHWAADQEQGVEGVGLVLITHDADNARQAAAAGIKARTAKEYVTAAGADYARLLEIIAAPAVLGGIGADEGDEVEGGGSGVGSGPVGASSKSSASALEAVAADVAAAAAAGAKPKSSSSSSSSTRSKGSSSTASGVYREHLTQQQLSDGVKTRTMFQGTLRVNRDCWFEARVLIHGVQGKGQAGNAATDGKLKDTGGDDAVSVLISGRESINRAMEADMVVIELLPQSQWKHPSTRLALQPERAEDADKMESAALRAEQKEGENTASSSSSSASAGASSSSSSSSSSSPAMTQQALAAAAAACASTGSVPTGRVIGILRRAWRPLCGSFEPEEPMPGAVADDGSLAPQSALFVPVDARFPRVRIETRQKWSLMDKRMVVALDVWDTHSKYPRGHYVRTIGPIGDKAAENEVILLEHDIIARPFSSDVIACLPPANWTITAENSAGRTDLRHIDVMSIDPPGCKDIDDALHARALDDDGNTVEVGVHIADVTYFVRHGTAIDVEAADRANTTYLVEKRMDMLPGLLTETLCSLKQHVDRFAFSVTWKFRRVFAKADGSLPPGYDKLAPADRWEMVPGSAEYFKSMIHSRAAMTYAAAQALLDDPVADTPVAKGVKLLSSIARSLRRRRIEAGALSLASNEVKFMLDSETHDPTDVMAYEMRETNSTVEEWMLAANIAVAERTVEAFPRYSLLRRHPAPPKSSFSSLLAAAKSVGVELNVETSRALADSLDQAQVAGNPYFNKLLRILATRCMMQATYFPSGETAPADYHHYGLAAPIYTHFTSPIRRYADVVVHRLLAAALEIDSLPREYEDKAYMRAQCDVMNKRHLMSQLAGRASAALHTNIFFNKRVVIETALVMRLRANGVVVLIPRFGIEGAIVLGRSKDDVNNEREGKASAGPQRLLSYNEEEQIVSDIASPETLRLGIFQEVKVALVVEEKARHRKELVYRVVDPPFDPVPVPVAGTGVTLEYGKGVKLSAAAAAAQGPAAAGAGTASSSSSSSGTTPVGGKRRAAAGDAAVALSPVAAAAAAGVADKRPRK